MLIFSNSFISFTGNVKEPVKKEWVAPFYHPDRNKKYTLTVNLLFVCFGFEAMTPASLMCLCRKAEEGRVMQKTSMCIYWCRAKF